MNKIVAQGVPFDLIEPDLSSLFRRKVPGWATPQEILKRLKGLGADIASGMIQLSYESLSIEAQQLFCGIVKFGLEGSLW